MTVAAPSRWILMRDVGYPFPESRIGAKRENTHRDPCFTAIRSLYVAVILLTTGPQRPGCHRDRVRDPRRHHRPRPGRLARGDPRVALRRVRHRVEPDGLLQCVGGSSPSSPAGYSLSGTPPTPTASQPGCIPAASRPRPRRSRRRRTS